MCCWILFANILLRIFADILYIFKVLGKQTCTGVFLQSQYKKPADLEESRVNRKKCRHSVHRTIARGWNVLKCPSKSSGAFLKPSLFSLNPKCPSENWHVWLVPVTRTVKVLDETEEFEATSLQPSPWAVSFQALRGRAQFLSGIQLSLQWTNNRKGHHV
jgi:hypothetical protein